MALMFQQEVAERICAAPDTDAYGRLAVLAQWRCRCTLLLRLPPGAFTPPPKVWSAVVGFVPHAEDPGEALFRAMERLTAAAFGQRRKMLRGALKSLGDAEALLAAAGIEGQRRAETLTVGGIRPHGPGAAGPSGLTRPPGMSPALSCRVVFRITPPTYNLQGKYFGLLNSRSSDPLAAVT